MTFSVSAIFCFSSSTSAKHFFEDFFIQETKKSHSEWDQVNREGGVWGSCCSWSKTAELLSVVWAGALVNHPSWNGQMLKEPSKKNSLKLNSASHNTSWYTDTDGFPEYSLNRESLYYKWPAPEKIILLFGGFPTL